VHVGYFLAYMCHWLASHLRSSVFWEVRRDMIFLVLEPRFSTCSLDFNFDFRKKDLDLADSLKQVIFILQYTHTHTHTHTHYSYNDFESTWKLIVLSLKIHFLIFCYSWFQLSFQSNFILLLDYKFISILFFRLLSLGNSYSILKLVVEVRVAQRNRGVPEKRREVWYFLLWFWFFFIIPCFIEISGTKFL